MKYLLIILFSLAILCSCNTQSNNVTLSDLEKKSLESGIVVDTILDNFYFGMPEWRINQTLTMYYLKKYRFSVPELKKYDFNTDPYFYNDSLYYLKFIAYNFANVSLSKHSLDPIINIYTIKYGEPDTVFTRNSVDYVSYRNIWYNGNLQIELSYSDHKYSGLSIEYKDLRRNIIMNNLVHDKTNHATVWTKDYYENVYLPKRKKELDGI